MYRLCAFMECGFFPFLGFWLRPWERARERGRGKERDGDGERERERGGDDKANTTVTSICYAFQCHSYFPTLFFFFCNLLYLGFVILYGSPNTRVIYTILYYII